MPTGLWDVKTQWEVLVPQEIEARFAQGCEDYPDHKAELVAGRDSAYARWHRCLLTANMIDKVRARHNAPHVSLVAIQQEGAQP